jgi:hypothetical protein
MSDVPETYTLEIVEASGAIEDVCFIVAAYHVGECGPDYVLDPLQAIVAVVFSGPGCEVNQDALAPYYCATEPGDGKGGDVMCARPTVVMICASVPA